jgi:hypothetical protein
VISEHRLTATVVAGNIALKPTEGTITLDREWAPYGQAEIVAPLENAAQLVAIDPRGDVRVSVVIEQATGRVDTLADMTRRWGAGPLSALSTEYAGDTVTTITNQNYDDWNTPGAPYALPTRRTLALGLRSRTIDHDARTVTMTLATHEAILQDFVWQHTTDLTVSECTTPLNVVHWGLVLVFGGTLGLSSWTADAGGISLDPSENKWPAGMSIWDWLYGITNRLGFRLWCDELGAWHLRTDVRALPYIATLSGAENVTDAVDTIDRDGAWANAVAIRWHWFDGNGQEQAAYDYAGLGANTPFRRVHTVTYESPYPGPGNAQRMLDRLRKAGRVIDAVAINDYRVEPGVHATVTIPETPAQTGIVSAVTWHFPDDVMEVKTRELTNA